MRFPFVFAGLMLCATSLHAQSAEEQAAAQAAAIQREQAQQAQQDPVIEAPGGARPQAPALVRSVAGQTCIDIEQPHLTSPV